MEEKIREDLAVIIKIATKMKDHPEGFRKMDAAAIAIVAEKIREELDMCHIIERRGCGCDCKTDD